MLDCGCIIGEDFLCWIVSCDDHGVESSQIAGENIGRTWKTQANSEGELEMYYGGPLLLGFSSHPIFLCIPGDIESEWALFKKSIV